MFPLVPVQTMFDKITFLHVGPESQIRLVIAIWIKLETDRVQIPLVGPGRIVVKYDTARRDDIFQGPDSIQRGNTC